MADAPPEIEALIDLMARLPGLGPRSARRAVLTMVRRRAQLMVPLAEALAQAAARVRECVQCGNVATDTLCPICADPKRGDGTLCVVEDVADLWAMERGGAFKGRYHVLGGTLSALDAVGPEELGIPRLVARVADVMLTTPIALHLLVVVGATTAVVASSVLVTQSSVKTALAWSSAAHMGFMLMLCGLGAFPVAILHLVAHSFYKAHAFLSSGSAVEVPRVTSTWPGAASWSHILLGLAAAGVTVAGVGLMLGVDITEKPVTFGLAGVIAIALTQLWAVGFSASRGLAFILTRVVVWSTATTLAFFGLELTAASMLAGAVPVEPMSDPASVVLLVGVIAAFAAVVALQLRLPALAGRPAFRALRVHLGNGLYANAWFDRLIRGWTAERRDISTSFPNAR